MKKHFTCHPIRDGHTYQASTVGWMVVSSDNDGIAYSASYLQTAKDKALAEHPKAAFSEAFWIQTEEQHVLQEGPLAYIWWMRNGKPDELDPGKPWTLNP